MPDLNCLPWVAHYDPGVPASLAPYPDKTLLDYLSASATQHPDRPALLFKGRRISYSELDRLSDSFAVALTGLGVGSNDRVALLLPNCPQFFISELAAWKLGAIVAPLNPIYADPELEQPIHDHGIETIVTLTRFYERVKRIQSRTPLRRVIACNIKEFFPPLLRMLFTLARERREGDRIALRSGDADFARLLRQNAGRKPPDAAIGPESPAVLLMSGGTSGTPKGVLGNHAAYVCAGLQIGAWMSPALDAAGADVILLPLPLFHVYANVGVQAFAFVTANPIALVPNPRDLDDVVRTIREVRPAFFNGVPTLYVALLNHAAVQRGVVDFKSIKICFSGAAPLMVDTKRRFESLTGGRIVEGYSLTEAMMALAVNPVNGPNKIGSVGLPLPDVQMRIYDADSGARELPPHGIGEICISAPQLMAGFWNRPEETAGVLRDHEEGQAGRRWLHTGDLGYFDEEGYLFIVDRKKDLIKTSGYQVWPREVEEALAGHPAVAEVGVAGVPDELKGEAIKAWVVLRVDAAASGSELREYCRERLAHYKVPSEIEFRASLPKTMVGKILRRALNDNP